MVRPATLDRLRHPFWMVFLLGGGLGAGVNLGTTLLAQGLTGWDLRPCFFLGTLLNQVFHLFYFRVVFVNREIRMRTPLPLHLLLMAGVSLLAAFLLGTFQALGLPSLAALLASLALLSAVNTLLNRISTFSSAEKARVEYREMNESYYDDFSDPTKVSPFRAWYHGSRYKALDGWVRAHYRKGMRLADLGCGNCRWNEGGLPVTGVDINGKMLRWAKRKGRLERVKEVADLARTGLPSKAYPLVVMSEVLEHLPDHEGTLKEVRRILKEDGTFLMTVPYDVFLGPFFILFNLNCLYMGYVKGSDYHKYRCGHIHHFTRSRLRALLQANGFLPGKVFVVNGLLLYASAKKDPAWGPRRSPSRKG